MSKFKVGDEVAIAAVVKITGIQNCATGAVTYQTDRGFCIHEVLMDEIALSAKSTDRLIGREEPKSQPAPEPLYAHYFKHSVEAEKRSSMKIGDRVVHPIHGSGTVVGFERDNMGDWVWYMEDGDNSRPYPGSEGVLKKIAPEPKYYTGRVVCISGEYGIGKIYTVVNGRFTDKTMNIALPYKSVEHMNQTFLFGTVAEVKV